MSRAGTAWRTHFPRRLFWWLTSFLAGLVLLVLVAWRVAVRQPYPELSSALPASTLILGLDGSVLGNESASDRSWHLPLAHEVMNPFLAQAIIAIEDQRFYRHQGVDWHAVLGSACLDLRHLGIRRGGSTITMQLERLRHPRQRGFANKLLEALRACQLERGRSKAEILEEYLDRASFAGNAVGAATASRLWYGRPLSQLSLAQCALLAGLPQGPTRLNPQRHPEAARARRDVVLQAMRDQGMISREECLRAMAEAMEVRRRPAPPPWSQGLAGCCPGATGVVTTTLDPALQELTWRLARRQLQDMGRDGLVAVVVVDNREAAFRALVSLGGPRDLDLTRIQRSPGSALKPFLYAAAYAQRLLQPMSVLLDEPAAWRGFAPQNMDHGYLGEISAEEALAQSRNVPAMRLLAGLGVAPLGELLESCGLTGMALQASRAGLDLAVGGCVVSPRDLAEGYATIANLGVHRQLRVRMADCPASPSTSAPARVLATLACQQILAGLDDPARTTACVPVLRDSPVAWKTGTSSGCRDAWCAACTPRYTVVVWRGTECGAGAPELTGVGSAAPLALAVISAIDHPATDCGSPAAGVVGPPAPHAQPPVWTHAATTSADAVAVAARACVLGQELVIVSPGDGVHLCQDPDRLEPGLRLPLLCAGGGGGRRWWFDNGTPIGDVAAGAPLQAPLSLGAHRLHVIDAGGRSAWCRVVVEGAPH
jgi:penicillin-binding protein 1C